MERPMHIVDEALRCPACEYSLVGLSGDVCPECGEEFDRTELAVSWAESRTVELPLIWRMALRFHLWRHARRLRR